jgi:hypothetical protein
MLSIQLRPKVCAMCPREFIPRSSFATVCSQRCAMRKLKADKTKEREAFRERREAIKTIPQLIKEAQHAFNAYVRERDRQAGHRCISSGRVLDWSGNGVDAGHYRSVGSASHLRFNENNCHAQSKHDNQWKSGNAVDYRIGLIQRIGLEAVEALEADNTPHKWTREELIAIRATYKAKLKQLEKEQE